MLAGAAAANFSGLLKDAAVKNLLLDALKEVGCKPPANHLVLWCLDKAVLGATSWLGQAALGRSRKSLPNCHPWPSYWTGSPA